MSSHPGSDPLAEYWDWFAVALFILITVDMIKTIYAAWYVGHAAEANPLMRWALGQGMLTVALVNLAATVIAVGGFYVLMQLVETTTTPYNWYLAFGVEVWLGVIIAAGLFVFSKTSSSNSTDSLIVSSEWVGQSPAPVHLRDRLVKRPLAPTHSDRQTGLGVA